MPPKKGQPAKKAPAPTGSVSKEELKVCHMSVFAAISVRLSVSDSESVATHAQANSDRMAREAPIPGEPTGDDYSGAKPQGRKGASCLLSSSLPA